MAPHFTSKIYYSDKYSDDTYEYRHVTLSQDAYEKLPESYRSFYSKLRNKDPYI